MKYKSCLSHEHLLDGSIKSRKDDFYMKGLNLEFKVQATSSEGE